MLWNEGVNVFDAYKKETFKLRALLFTTINDLPTYGNLLGYSVKGHKACPICEDDTNFIQLKHERILKEKNPKKSDIISNEHNKSFIGWFKEYVPKQKDVSNRVRLLAMKPQFLFFVV